MKPYTKHELERLDRKYGGILTDLFLYLCELKEKSRPDADTSKAAVTEFNRVHYTTNQLKSQMEAVIK